MEQFKFLSQRGGVKMLKGPGSDDGDSKKMCEMGWKWRRSW